MSVALAVAAQLTTAGHASSGVIPALVIGSLGVLGLVISQIIIGVREGKGWRHELDRDQAARAYEHRATAYLQQFRYLERVGAYVAGVVPMGAAPAHTDPPFPSTDEQFDTQGGSRRSPPQKRSVWMKPGGQSSTTSTRLSSS